MKPILNLFRRMCIVLMASHDTCRVPPLHHLCSVQQPLAIWIPADGTVALRCFSFLPTVVQMSQS